MQNYTVPRQDFDLLLEAMGDRKTAENFAKIIESVAIDAIDDERAMVITEKLGTYTMPREVIDSFKEMIKIEIKDELKKELVTREIFEERFKVIEERFNVVDEKLKSLEKVMNEKFNSLNFKLNIFIALALIALAFANPAFVQLIAKLF